MAELREKAKILDDNDMRRAIARLAHEILEKNQGAQDLMLVGIRRRGIPLAQRLQEEITSIENVTVPVGELDITLYRDDLSMLGPHPIVHQTVIPKAVDGTTVVLVDDVIYTGRTVRAGLDALFDLGRPKAVQLCVLIDRGHRELPIRPDFTGKNVPTSQKEVIEVHVKEIDGEDAVYIMEKVENN
ncbi:bifunctional pyr operon transcriptional regulator/uracil phosphoribosyltransferase PyrR [Coprothermobacter platensis]|uniref:bifunctional pyr operon transcriptional regulator/uracil phosphoribosyltransferase PyrR n=1 Tax=Coprothermobacter platensis TaxID=108819 RepID=UPI000379BFE1|nr:bifunctional pyr operon transcriptional regulator/uracil phosphoribosyltransferase PyrR [Coprothermobacter platensis]